MKVLSFGSLLTVLAKYKATNTSQVDIFMSLLRPIDPNYVDYMASPDQRANACKKCKEVPAVDGAELRKVDVFALARAYKNDLINHINVLKMDHVIAALQLILEDDDNIKSGKHLFVHGIDTYAKEELFDKTGAKSDMFLAHLCLFCLRNVVNTDQACVDGLADLKGDFWKDVNERAKDIIVDEVPTAVESVVKPSLRINDADDAFNPIEMPDNVWHPIFQTESPTDLRFYHLDMGRGSFNYEKLNRLLRKLVITYVFSRSEIEMSPDQMILVLDAIDRMGETYSGDGSELGDMLNYFFLEKALRAPRIMSNVELHSSGFNYLATGVHFLTINAHSKRPNYYQYVFAVSEIQDDLSQAIDAAFDAVKKMDQDNSHELKLVDRGVLGSQCDKQVADIIKETILPQKRERPDREPAYGIFIGYTFQNMPSNTLSGDRRTEHVRNVLKAELESRRGYIEQKIKDEGLEGRSLYFYIVPFTKADTDKDTIMRHLLKIQ